METRLRKIYVEIGNVCNLQCSFCPEVERKKTQLTAEELRAILVQIKPHTDRVCFHLMGEPLAHPGFVGFVEVAAAVGIPVEITTNGTLLQADLENALLHPIVQQVNFSLQSFFDNFPAANPKTYLQKIFAFCERAMREREDLYLNLRLWNLSAEDQQDERNAFLLSEIETFFQVEINRRVDPRLRKSKKLKNRLYLHYDTRFLWPSLKSPFLRTAGSCQGTRTHLGIHADGTVVPCCLDKEAAIPLGNIRQQDFQEILKSSRLQKIKQGFERGQLVEDLCQKCTYATRFS